MKKGVIPSKEIAELIVALYSVSQDCFHVEQLKDYVFTNTRNSLMKHNKSDYRLIGIFEKELDAHDYIDIFRKTLEKADSLSIDRLINKSFDEN